MKNFKFKIRGNTYEVNVHNFEDETIDVEVNGTLYKVDVEREIKTSKTPKLVRPSVVNTGNADKARTNKPDDRKGAGNIKAPLPGTILEMKVKKGDPVKVGDTLLIMEAMKMENNIKSDKEGIIEEVLVAVNDSVLEGDCLVRVGSN
ncbi:MAG: biotin/lipoyl-binding protein [Chlorobi bacterium]|nr:biotin/lipoyl-binding protein [Chlorobiota bacterium]